MGLKHGVVRKKPKLGELKAFEDVGTNKDEFVVSVVKLTPFKWTDKQREIIKAICREQNSLVIVNAIFGSGKTLVAVHALLQAYYKGEIKKIVYVRTPLQSGRTGAQLGFLSGDLQQKLEPFFQPMMEKLIEIVGKTEADKLVRIGAVEIIPTCLLRGRSFVDCGVILDEAQNCTKEELILIATRIGLGSKLVIIGDNFQCDIGKASGFKEIYDIFNDDDSLTEGISCHEMLEANDIMRNPFLRFFMEKIYKSA